MQIYEKLKSIWHILECSFASIVLSAGSMEGQERAILYRRNVIFSSLVYLVFELYGPTNKTTIKVVLLGMDFLNIPVLHVRVFLIGIVIIETVSYLSFMPRWTSKTVKHFYKRFYSDPRDMRIALNSKNTWRKAALFWCFDILFPFGMFFSAYYFFLKWVFFTP